MRVVITDCSQETQPSQSPGLLLFTVPQLLGSQSKKGGDKLKKNMGSQSKMLGVSKKKKSKSYCRNATY